MRLPRYSINLQANGSSELEFNFNTAVRECWFRPFRLSLAVAPLLKWFPGNGKNVHEGLVVRVQDNDKYPWWGCTGAVAVVPVNFSGSAARAGKVTAQSVVWPGVAAPPKLPPSICPPGKANCPAKLWGAIDPRIAYRPATQTYFLGWDNCSQGCS